MIQMLERALEPIRNRIRLMVARSVISAVSSDETGITLQLTLGPNEERADVDLVQQYGVSSKPKPGSQAVTLFVSGSRSEGVTIATKGGGAAMSFTLKPGEVALHTDEGDSVHLRRGRIVEVTTETLKISASSGVEIDTPTLTTTGNVEASGNVEDSLGSLAALRTAFNAHTHVSASPGSPTGHAAPQA